MIGEWINLRLYISSSRFGVFNSGSNLQLARSLNGLSCSAGALKTVHVCIVDLRYGNYVAKLGYLNIKY